MRDKVYEASFDGSSRPQEQRASISFIIYSSKKDMLCRSFRPVDFSTPTEVEYKALTELLRTAKGFGIKNIRIRGDCKAVVDIVNKRCPVHNPILSAMNDECMKLLSYFTYYKVLWVPRKYNKAADRLARFSLNPTRRK